MKTPKLTCFLLILYCTRGCLADLGYFVIYCACVISGMRQTCEVMIFIDIGKCLKGMNISLYLYYYITWTWLPFYICTYAKLKRVHKLKALIKNHLYPT